MGWFRQHLVADQGIIVHTKELVPYPEVTGYFVPTLYNWGERDLARRCTRWLLSVQMSNGAFPAPGGTPYTFDTGQVMRGLCAALDDMNDIEAPLRRACDWVVKQVAPDGRLTTPSTELWTGIANDLIHTYVLPPLAEAGRLLGVPDYGEAAQFVLSYYKKQETLVPFNRLSHFHAYAMEALCELGEVDLARRGMAEVERCQRRDGRIPAYPDVDWICSTGMAQYAVVWYMLGNRQPADRAIHYLERIQNRSGGFYGSYGNGAKYIPGAEISWAVKYFLDAHLRRMRLDGEEHA
jgi:malonyl-CoA O-methyltransferase